MQPDMRLLNLVYAAREEATYLICASREEATYLIYTWARTAHEEHEEQVIGTHKVRFWTGFHTIF